MPIFHSKAKRAQDSGHDYHPVDAASLHPLSPAQRLRVLVFYFCLPIALILLMQAGGAFNYLESKATGLRMNLYTARSGEMAAEARKRIVLVPISDNTFNDARFRHLGGPPVPRDYHAKVLGELVRAGAAVVVFDLLFDLPRPGNRALAAAARSAGSRSTPVVWACTWDKERRRLIMPLPQLQGASPHLGHTRTPHDAGEPQILRFEAVVRENGRDIPALSVQAVQLALRRSQQRAGKRSPDAVAPLANRDSAFTVSFLGMAGSTFPTVPYEQIYGGAVDDPIYKAKGFFRDKIVMIGDVTHLGNDYHPTPVGTMSGMEIHAHAIATLLQSAFVREAPPWLNGMAVLLLATLAYVLAALCTLRSVLPLVAFTALAYFAANIWLFVDRGTNLALVAPLLAATLVTLCAVTERGWREERERKRARNTLEQFVSPQVATAGVPTGTVTLLFADLENSSMLSALHGAAFEAVRATYYSLLRDAVKQWHGFEVETAGDSLFVVFSQADNAVRFAVEAQLSLARHAWPASIGPIQVRMGLHTGKPFVSKDRAKLTYRGPATNRAARVATIAQGGQVLISDATYTAACDALPPQITFRFHGHHMLRGVGEDNLYQVCHPDLRCDFAPSTDEDQAATARTPI